MGNRKGERAGVLLLSLMLTIGCSHARELMVAPSVDCGLAGAPGDLLVSLVDESGLPLPGIEVVLSGKGVVRRVRSGAPGTVAFTELPRAGYCRLEVPAEGGFERTIVRSVRCAPACRTRITLPVRFDRRHLVSTHD